MTNDFVTQWLFLSHSCLSPIPLGRWPRAGCRGRRWQGPGCFFPPNYETSVPRYPPNTRLQYISPVHDERWNECLKYLYIRDRRIELKVARILLIPSLKLIEGSHFLNGWQSLRYEGSDTWEKYRQMFQGLNQREESPSRFERCSPILPIWI